MDNDSHTAGRGPVAEPGRVLRALRESMGVPGGAGDRVADSREEEAAARRVAELTQQLLSFLLDMQRGMDEFRRVNGVAIDSEAGPPSQEAIVAGLFNPRGGGRIGEQTEKLMREIKVHHAALLEGYHEATQDGSLQILGELDPQAIRREYAGSSIQVGPFRLKSTWRPVLIQVIWEEFIRRFERLKGLAPSDFERFYRDGFRRGYKRFCDRGRSGGEASDH